MVVTGSCVAPKTQLEIIKEFGYIRVVTIYSPATYLVDVDSETGFEYELARMFADHLDVKLKIIVATNKADMLDILKRGDADIAAGTIKSRFSNDVALLSGPAYDTVTQKVIYKTGIDRPGSVADLYPFQLHIAEGSVHVERLEQLKVEHPDFNWKVHDDKSSSDLIDLIDEEQIAYAAVYSNELNLAQQSYPELRAAFDISEPLPLIWLLKNHGENSLPAEVGAFFRNIHGNGNLAELIEYFYGPVRKFDYVDQRKFVERFSSRFPQYETLFKQAADSYGFDWRLLAAMSYQESHWNERARSPTGVRGLMMLTLNTAKQVNVLNRLDPEQSIMGGARYIRRLSEAIPERIQEPDRTWLALAAYNIGFGHMEDARIITQKRGGNPDKWQDVRENLPLLQQRDWYKQTLFGYARGNEAVSYVENIRKYYNTLVQLTRENGNMNDAPAEPERIIDIQSRAL